MKLLCLLVLLSITITDWITAETKPDNFLGSWIAQSMFLENADRLNIVRMNCFTVHLAPSNRKCSCEGIPMTTFIVNMSFLHTSEIAVRPKIVFIVDSYEEAFDAAHRHCNCGKGEFNVFRQLDSNHYLSYFQSHTRHVLDAVLLSRQLPTRLEMEAYEAQHLPEFKNKYRVAICTRKLLYQMSLKQ